MATNQYFKSLYNSSQRDQKLAEDLIKESIQIHGVDVKYLPRRMVDLDEIYGEPDSSYFDKFYTIEMYLKNIEGFGGDKEFMSQYGIQIQDEVTMSVSRVRFAEEITTHENDLVRPMEGDLIALPNTIDTRQRLFMISYVNKEEQFYQFGKLYTWELRCRAYEHSSEEFNTGDVQIDSIDDQFDINIEVKMGSGNGLDYIIGEQVSITGSFNTAKVMSWDDTNKLLVLDDINGNITEGSVVSGVQSGALWKVVNISSREANTKIYSDADNIVKESTGFILFDETNPFSE